jgi:hypothetical protein
VASEDCELDRLRWASIDAMLVLIERVMMIPIEVCEDFWRKVSGKSTGVISA